MMYNITAGTEKFDV